MLALDSAAVQWSAPERSRPGRPLLVLAHGRGADERDLFALSPSLPLGATVASVRAPIAEGSGWSWFDPATVRSADVGLEEADAAAQALLDWLDGQDTSGGVGVLGFSQGGIVAVEALRLAPTRLDWVVALSSTLAEGAHPGDARLEELQPPVFWGRGSDDPRIRPEAFTRSGAWLARCTRLTERVYPGIGHGISTPETREVAGWIGERLRAGRHDGPRARQEEQP